MSPPARQEPLASNDRLHERMDAMFREFSDLRVIVERSLAHCEPCRKIVMGNGKGPLADQIHAVSERVKSLETTKSDIAWGIARLIAVAGVSATIVSLVVGVAFKLLVG